MKETNEPATMPFLLLVNLSKSWGGGEKWMFSVAEAWQARGHRVHLLVYPDSALAQRLTEAGIPFSAMALRSLSLLNPVKVGRLAGLLKNLNPDAMLLNASHELKTAGLVGHWVGVPEIVFRRGVSYALTPNRLNRWLLQRVATRFLANSQATFQAMTTAFPSLLSKPHLTLNNGIDPSDWQPDPARRKPFRIGVSARLSPEKGLERLIEAVALVRESVPEVELRIMGEGPQRAELQALAEAKGVAGHVQFAGFVADVVAELQTCQVFGFTPHFGEGTSLALIEAMLLELPCVVMDSPAMSEVVLDGETGFVVPDGDVAALAARFTLLLQQTDLSQSMGKAGRQRALAHFTLDRIVDALQAWVGK
jgi:glycosyltransferase involved in cell wall biosynthesis